MDLEKVAPFFADDGSLLYASTGTALFTITPRTPGFSPATKIGDFGVSINTIEEHLGQIYGIAVTSSNHYLVRISDTSATPTQVGNSTNFGLPTNQGEGISLLISIGDTLYGINSVSSSASGIFPLNTSNGTSSGRLSGSSRLVRNGGFIAATVHKGTAYLGASGAGRRGGSFRTLDIETPALGNEVVFTNDQNDQITHSFASHKGRFIVGAASQSDHPHIYSANPPNAALTVIGTFNRTNGRLLSGLCSHTPA